MQKEYITESAKETMGVAANFTKTLRGGNVVLLDGDLGSGKTTFAQGILEALGAEKPYTSPTFVIMKEYRLPNSQSNVKSQMSKVFHIDTYRVALKDILDLGWKDLLDDTSALILLEWPERVKDILPVDATIVRFEHAGENVRKIIFS